MAQVTRVPAASILVGEPLDVFAAVLPVGVELKLPILQLGQRAGGLIESRLVGTFVDPRGGIQQRAELAKVGFRKPVEVVEETERQTGSD